MDEPILIKAKAIEQRASDGCVTVEVDTVTGKLQMFVYPEQLTAERTGKWITHKSTDFGEKLNHCIECSECGIWFSACELLRRSYCPNCGARMEGNNE